MNAKDRSGKSALDQFLPERMFAPEAQRAGGATHIDAAEIQLEPIDGGAEKDLMLRHPANSSPSARVQAWPMIAAALVAIGVSLLALAAIAQFGNP